MAGEKSILLVEDEPLLATLLKQRIEKEGIKVIVARDGEEGLEMLRNEKPTLVLLYVILPKMSGFEMMEMMKNDPSIQKVPIIITSNLGQEADIEKGKLLGAIGHFVKAQVSIEEVVKKIKEFLG